MDGFNWASVLDAVMAGDDLGRDTAAAAMAEIMAGRASDAQVAAFIVGLRTKGETADEMAGMVDSMMDAAVTVEPEGPVVDIVGTGGDGYGTFNIALPQDLALAGLELFAQWFIWDAGAPNGAASTRSGRVVLF